MLQIPSYVWNVVTSTKLYPRNTTTKSCKIPLQTHNSWHDLQWTRIFSPFLFKDESCAPEAYLITSELKHVYIQCGVHRAIWSPWQVDATDKQGTDRRTNADVSSVSLNAERQRAEAIICRQEAAILRASLLHIPCTQSYRPPMDRTTHTTS